MANDVLIDGRLGTDPDIKEKEGKRHCTFDIAHQPSKRWPARWHTIRCSGKVAEIVLDGIDIHKGDFVRIIGFLVSGPVTFGCGQSHRASWIQASHVYLIAPAAGREDRMFVDAERSTNFKEAL